jgi:DNA-binding CsgD family transcriptional regulator
VAGGEGGLALIAQALDALSLAGFVCEAEGGIRARSRAGEALLAAREHLTDRGGRLAATSEPDARMLQAALRSAAWAGEGAAPTVLVIRHPVGEAPLLLEVLPLPAAREALEGRSAALVVVRPHRSEARRAAAVARALFGLTQAEGAIVAELAAGLAPQAIAERAGVSVGTVRTHMRNIYAKAGVRSQVELVAAVTARL